MDFFSRKKARNDGNRGFLHFNSLKDNYLQKWSEWSFNC